MKKLKLLVVDDDESIRQVMEFVLKDNFAVTVLSDGQEAVERLYFEHYDIILLDIRMPRLNGMDALRKIQKIAPNTDVVMLSATVNLDITSSAMHMGALNYLTKPFEMDDLLSILLRLAKKKELISKSNKMQDQISESKRMGDFVGNSDDVVTIRASIQKVAPTRSTLLLVGERGVEHDILAYMLFQLSTYQEAFKIINCAVTPLQIEEELFGKVYEDKETNELPYIGFITTGNGGTLYLKNVDKLSLPMQRKMVSWLEVKGSADKRDSDIRLIAATTTKLQDLVAAGKFDEELYHYLNEITLFVPAVRDRSSDVPLLVEYYLQKYNKEFSKRCLFSSEVFDVLCRYPWPGNTSEINTVMRRLVLIASGTIALNQLPFNIVIQTLQPKAVPLMNYDMFVNGFVWALVRILNFEYKGNKDFISTILGISTQKLNVLLEAAVRN